jgi:hypothetical protein
VQLAVGSRELVHQCCTILIRLLAVGARRDTRSDGMAGDWILQRAGKRSFLGKTAPSRGLQWGRIRPRSAGQPSQRQASGGRQERARWKKGKRRACRFQGCDWLKRRLVPSCCRDPVAPPCSHSTLSLSVLRHSDPRDWCKSHPGSHKSRYAIITRLD